MKYSALAAALFVLIPVGAAAQTGQVTYQRTQRVNLDLPEEMAQFSQYVPKAVTLRYEMAFDGERARTRIAESAAPDLATFKKSFESGGDGSAMLKMAFNVAFGSSGSFAPVLVESFVDYAEGDRIVQQSFMDRQFLITDELKEIGWKLSGEEAQFLDRRVMKATAVQDTVSVEAWFAPEIPAPLGPGGYTGLPGLILMLNMNDGEILFEADSVALDVDVDLARPDRGREVTQAEFDRLVAEKLDELTGHAGVGRPFFIRKP